jgi:endonuclease G
MPAPRSKSQLHALMQDTDLRKELAALLAPAAETAATTRAARSGARGGAAAAETVGGTAASPLAGLDARGTRAIIEGRFDAVDDARAEAIILARGRPALFVRDDRLELPQPGQLPELLLKRLRDGRAAIERRLPSVGRLDIINDTRYDHIGTAWLIDRNIAVTNRHVAEFFTQRDGAGYRARPNEDGKPYRTEVDFKREHRNPDERDFDIRRVLYIEPANGPDIAFLELDFGSEARPEPLALATRRAKRGDDIIVVGYPAYDSRNDADLMRQLFGDAFSVKRAAPGRVAAKPAVAGTFSHDCTTLGGNSGSPVLLLADGSVVGLHFQGRYRDTNHAVDALAVADRLARLKPTVSVPARPLAPTATTDEAASGKPSVASLRDRKGYDPKFLGTRVPLPKPVGRNADDIATSTHAADGVLPYTHYSVLMRESRRMAWFTACNIDGARTLDVKRTKDVWHLDPRLPADVQAGEELYARNKLQRGHLTRRLDPSWGDTREQAVRAIADTFFFTNCTPQHEQFNPKTWLALEDHVLDTADAEDLRISVCTGPVFRRDDPKYRGLRLPQEYWKVVAWREAGSLRSAAYLLSQAQHLDDLEFIFGSFRTYALPLATLADRVDLDFGPLADVDVYTDESGAGWREVDFGDGG